MYFWLMTMHLRVDVHVFMILHVLFPCIHGLLLDVAMHGHVSDYTLHALYQVYQYMHQKCKYSINHDRRTLKVDGDILTTQHVQFHVTSRSRTQCHVTFRSVTIVDTVCHNIAAPSHTCVMLVMCTTDCLRHKCSPWKQKSDLGTSLRRGEDATQ